MAGRTKAGKGLMRRLLPATLGLTFALVLSMAANARKPKREEGPAAELRQVPPSAMSLQNPFAGQSQAAAAGRKLFQQHCSPCHGLEARGQDNAPDLHSPAIQNAPPGSLFWILRNGKIRKGMPSWSRLPDQQLWQIVTYLKTLESGRTPK